MLKLQKEIYKYLSYLKAKRDREKIEKFMEKFQDRLGEKYSYNFNIELRGGKDEGKFTIMAECDSSEEIGFDNGQKFRVVIEFIYSQEQASKREDKLNDEEVELVLANRSKLVVIYIPLIRIKDKHKGLGSFIVSQIINLGKEMPQIDKICLSAGDGSRGFWRKMEFRGMDNTAYHIKEKYDMQYSLRKREKCGKKKK